MKQRLHVMLLVMLAGWINRHQQEMIDYLKEENNIFREKLGKKRLLLNDDQRRRLAVLGKKLGRKTLAEICNACSPDALLRWHRALVARKYDGSKRRGMGRPQIISQSGKKTLKKRENFLINCWQRTNELDTNLTQNPFWARNAKSQGFVSPCISMF